LNFLKQVQSRGWNAIVLTEFDNYNLQIAELGYNRCQEILNTEGVKKILEDNMGGDVMVDLDMTEEGRGGYEGIACIEVFANKRIHKISNALPFFHGSSQDLSPKPVDDTLFPYELTILPSGTDIHGYFPIKSKKSGRTGLLCFHGYIVPPMNLPPSSIARKIPLQSILKNKRKLIPAYVMEPIKSKYFPWNLQYRIARPTYSGVRSSSIIGIDGDNLDLMRLEVIQCDENQYPSALLRAISLNGVHARLGVEFDRSLPNVRDLSYSLN